MKPQVKGYKRIINAFGYSWLGFKAAYKHEEAFRQELILIIIGVPLAFIIGDTSIQVALLIVSLLLMMIVELLNSAIEAVVDRAGSEWNEYAGRAKDMGSAAVLLAGLIVVITWVGVILN